MRVAEQVIDETFAALGIRPDQVFRAKQAELWTLINKPGLDQGDIKRLADALELKAMVAGKLNVLAPFARVHAMKFYAITGAIDSLIRVGQDLAGEFVARHDFVGAREVLEQHVMPVVVDNQILNRHLDVRAQYAVVLAYCGLYSEAERDGTASGLRGRPGTPVPHDPREPTPVGRGNQGQSDTAVAPRRASSGNPKEQADFFRGQDRPQ